MNLKRSDITLFEDKVQKINNTLESLEKKSSRFSVFRFFVFLFAAIATVVAITSKVYALFILTVLCFAGFILLCVFHGKVVDEISYNKALLKVVRMYVARYNGNFDELYNIRTEDLKSRELKEVELESFSGSEFIKPNHGYCVDLNLFGKKSLFSLYNVSETAFGSKFFAQELLNASENGRTNEEIVLIQEAVKELFDDVDFMEHYQAVAINSEFKNMPLSLMLFAKDGKAFSPVKSLIYKLMPLLWLIPIIVLFINSKLAYPFALAVIAVHLIVWMLGIVNNGMYFKNAYAINKQGKALKKLYDIVYSKKYKSDYINNLIGITSESSGYLTCYSELNKALLFTNLRSQPIIAFALNAFYPLDYFAADKLGKWSEKYGEEMCKSINSLGRFESLMSIANVGIASSNVCFPKFVSSEEIADNAFFDGKNLVHPLLNPATVQANSIKLDSNIAIITGSNMSGKTTMIRTVGVASVLAYIGAMVPGDEVTLGRMRIMTSMRVVDSIEENMSTFKAELVRIASIVEESKKEVPLLFLIDEIFRGTNSDDRTEGAYTVLKNLSKTYITGLMTTHDYALVDQTSQSLKSVVYYHFSERYNDDGLTFDYKIAEGISRSSNAKYLMNLVGIT